MLALHQRVLKDALAIRTEPNATTLHAEKGEGFQSATHDSLRSRRSAVDPFAGEQFVDEAEAYQRLCQLTEEALDSLIAVLLVDRLTGHGARETPLIGLLAKELSVSIRKHWAPDAQWLAGYKKNQLADLIGKLQGPAHGSAALGCKKSELVDELAELFREAASDPEVLGDAALSDRLSRWVPARRAE